LYVLLCFSLVLIFKSKRLLQTSNRRILLQTLKHNPKYTGLTGCSPTAAPSPVDGVCICGSADPVASRAAACGGVAPAAPFCPAAALSGLSCSAAGGETCPAAKGDGADPAFQGEGDPFSGDGVATLAVADGVATLTEAEGGESEATGKLRTQDVRGARQDCGDPLPCWAGDLGEDAADPAWDETSLTCGMMGWHG